MNDIKEIIRLNCNEEIDVKYFNKNNEITDTTMDYSQLLDYITNLQQELEAYKDTETYSKRFLYKANKDRLNANLELVKELDDYKSRIDKAIEYIKENSNALGVIETIHIRNLLNILRGNDK